MFAIEDDDKSQMRLLILYNFFYVLMAPLFMKKANMFAVELCDGNEFCL
jgi:hypothetical protein